MIKDDLLKILRCPLCVKENKGQLSLHKETWLVCSDCGRKYPIVEDIPVMLIAEGDKWQPYRLEDLPIPPPRPE